MRVPATTLSGGSVFPRDAVAVRTLEISWGALALGAVLVACGLAGPAGALVIGYEAIDTPDAGPLDRWIYRYTVSDGSFSRGEGFSVLFDAKLYLALGSPPPPVNADWDAIVLQPDPLLPDAGRYDAQALIDVPRLEDAFEVSFAWLGTGTPGRQRFERYDRDFHTVASGETTLIPEPGTFALLGGALLGLLARARRR
jgi:hypothetical protein